MDAEEPEWSRHAVATTAVLVVAAGAEAAAAAAAWWAAVAPCGPVYVSRNNPNEIRSCIPMFTDRSLCLLDKPWKSFFLFIASDEYLLFCNIEIQAFKRFQLTPQRQHYSAIL